MSKPGRDLEILAVARAILSEQGLSAVSFDAIARRIGCSKQAVLYWYPSKHDLLAEMFLPWLEAEADAADAALSSAGGQAEAIGAFVRGIAQFHLSDLDRFRMMYLAPQTIGGRKKHRPAPAAIQRVHPVTNRIYQGLAARLDGNGDAARKTAVAIHASTLGLIMMIALGAALDDPLKHSNDALIEALIASLTGK